MSTIYIDRDGDEWKKSCSGCSKRNENRQSSNRTYCDALREYLSDGGQFSSYYHQYPNSCSSFYPKS